MCPPGLTHCLRGLPFGWSRVAAFRREATSHRPGRALASRCSRGRCHVRCSFRPIGTNEGCPRHYGSVRRKSPPELPRVCGYRTDPESEGGDPRRAGRGQPRNWRRLGTARQRGSRAGSRPLSGRGGQPARTIPRRPPAVPPPPLAMPLPASQRPWRCRRHRAQAPDNLIGRRLWPVADPNNHDSGFVRTRQFQVGELAVDQAGIEEVTVPSG